jgi:hypothetical protein
VSEARGGTRFKAGMRVTVEHLDHLQDVLHSGLSSTRRAQGAGVVEGLRVEKGSTPETLSVSPGLAFDPMGRELAVEESRVITPDFSAQPSYHLAISHKLRFEGLVDGFPTLIFDDVELHTRPDAPPYVDGAIVFAKVEKAGDDITVTQLGDWYLPASNHRHTGEFVTRQGRWQYDGDRLGDRAQHFDSGFLAVDPGDSVLVNHNLGSNVAVHEQVRRDGTVTNRGAGTEWWYELAGEDQIRLARAESSTGGLELRVLVFPLDPFAADAPIRPVADPGGDRTVSFGRSFTLDGSRSRAFGGRSITTFSWILIS